MCSTVVPTEPAAAQPPDGRANAYVRQHAGTGDWEAWVALQADAETLSEAIDDWRAQLSGVRRPWLCWNAHDRFCRIQQKLVLEFGWTPVVAWDPEIFEPRDSPHPDPPTVLSGAVRFDVNRILRFPRLWMFFPLEFVHRFVDRIAFWHSDLLVGRRRMQQFVDLFNSIDDGETAARKPETMRRRDHHICPALAGCTTRAAAQDQWTRGCGWWRWFAKHPNFSGKFKLRGNNWDHGNGIRFWKQVYGGRVHAVDVDDVGHCRVPWAQWKGRMTKSEAIERFFDVAALLKRLDIEDLDD